MPSNKNAVIRYMFLDQMLSDRYHKYTCEDLLKKVNEKLDFAGYPTIGGEKSDYERYVRSGKRVIQLDIQALQDAPFNMVIDSSERLDGAPVYRYADQTQSLFSKQLSDDEKRLLQEVLNTLGQFSGLDSFEWLNDLQEKLNDCRSFGRSDLDGQDTVSRRIISFSSNDYLQGKAFLGTLFSLIANRIVVDVDYAPFDGDVRTIRMYPYLLKQYNDRWYLIGTPLETKKHPFRKDFYVNLPLDRMKAVHPADGVPFIDCEEGFEERYEDIVGTTYIESVDLTPIVVAVKDLYRGYVDTKPIHGSQVKFPAEDQERLHQEYDSFDGYTFYGLNLKPNREFFNYIYQNGEDILLVSPRTIREKMIEELESSLYKLKSIRCE